MKMSAIKFPNKFASLCSATTSNSRRESSQNLRSWRYIFYFHSLVGKQHETSTRLATKFTFAQTFSVFAVEVWRSFSAHKKCKQCRTKKVSNKKREKIVLTLRADNNNIGCTFNEFYFQNQESFKILNWVWSVLLISSYERTVNQEIIKEQFFYCNSKGNIKDHKTLCWK